MQHNIDSLFYEARGCNGGGPFVTPRAKIKNVKIFRRTNLLRSDGIAITDTDGNVHRFGNLTFPESQTIIPSDHLKEDIHIYYLAEEAKNMKLSDNEPCYGGAYGLAFLAAGKKPEPGTCESMMAGIDNTPIMPWPSTKYTVQDGFVFSGFHGRYGGRIDKLGIILEREY